PMDEIQQGLRQGRISCSWKMVRSWVKPAPLSNPSPYDETMLDLPLKVVTPLFLARQKEGNQSKEKVAIDETIPNLFFGFPQTEAASPIAPPPPPSPVVAKPVDTNDYVWDDDSDQPRQSEAAVKVAPSPGTK